MFARGVRDHILKALPRSVSRYGTNAELLLSLSLVRQRVGAREIEEMRHANTKRTLD